MVVVVGGLIIRKRIQLFLFNAYQHQDIKLEHVKIIKLDLSHNAWVCFTPGDKRDGYMCVYHPYKRGGSVGANDREHCSEKST